MHKYNKSSSGDNYGAGALKSASQFIQVPKELWEAIQYSLEATGFYCPDDSYSPGGSTTAYCFTEGDCSTVAAFLPRIEIGVSSKVGEEVLEMYPS